VGVCAEPGYCAFEDPDCESGLVFGDFAGDGLANQCVPGTATDTESPASTTGTSASTVAPGSSTGPSSESSSSSGSSSGSLDTTGASSTGVSACPEDWWDCAWRYRRPVAVQWKGAGVLDFPAQVRLDETRLSFDEASVSGADLRFVMGSVPLAHEVVTWDASGQAEAWLRIPDLSSDEPLHVYYGNPDASDRADPVSVWSNGYIVVLHLIDETDTLGLLDLPPAVAERVPGLVGEGLQFTGNSTFLQDQGAPVPLFEEMTSVSLVFNASAWGQGGFGRLVDASDINTTATGYSIAVAESGDGGLASLRFGRGYDLSRGTWYTPDNSVALDEWFVASFAYVDGLTNIPRAWIGGEPQALSQQVAPAGNPVPPPLPVTIGALGTTELRYFDGVIDELHIALADRDDAWMAAEHLSFTDQLLSFGPEQALER